MGILVKMMSQSCKVLIKYRAPVYYSNHQLHPFSPSNTVHDLLVVQTQLSKHKTIPL